MGALELPREAERVSDLDLAKHELLCTPDPRSTYAPTGTATDVVRASSLIAGHGNDPVQMERLAAISDVAGSQVNSPGLADSLAGVVRAAAAGDMVYVAPDICEQIAYSAESMPEPINIDPADYGLGDFGIVLFGRAITDQQPTWRQPQLIYYTGLIWGYGNGTADDPGATLWIAPFLTTDEMLSGAPDMRPAKALAIHKSNGPITLTNGVHLMGHRPRRALHDFDGTEIRIKVWGTIGAWWHQVLMALFNWMQGTAEVNGERVSRADARSYSSAHQLDPDAEIPDVRYVRYRRSERTSNKTSEDYGGASGRVYTHRWVVKGERGDGFWRTYRIGPRDGDQEKVTRWILPYEAGPADLPLRTKRTVRKAVD